MTSMFRDYFTLSASQKATVGDTKMSVTSADHLGWLKCDGRLLNVADFYFLFQLIGYSFGGSGTQFRLPSAAGHVLGAFGQGTVGVNTLTNRLLGANIGEENHTLTIAEMPTHRHDGSTEVSSTQIKLTDPGHSHTYIATSGTSDTSSYSGLGKITVNAGTGEITTGSSKTDILPDDPQHKHAFTTSYEGGSNAHNNMQPTLFIGNVFIYSGKTTYGNYSYNYPYYPSTLVL
jgi:microcystin-dependent protein